MESARIEGGGRWEERRWGEQGMRFIGGLGARDDGLEFDWSRGQHLTLKQVGSKEHLRPNCQTP